MWLSTREFGVSVIRIFLSEDQRWRVTLLRVIGLSWLRLVPMNVFVCLFTFWFSLVLTEGWPG